MTIGDRIRKKREDAGISQTDLAKAINVSKQTLYKYENNIITNIPSDKIERIAKILAISPVYLMGWDENAMNKVYHIKLKVNGSIIENTMQVVSKHEAIGKILEIIPTATYKDIIEIKEDA